MTDISWTTQQLQKRMKSIEYQAFIKLRDNVWTTVFQEIVQDWTTSKCNVIAQQVKRVTNLGVVGGELSVVNRISYPYV
jgi:hypothetical protein